MGVVVVPREGEAAAAVWTRYALGTFCDSQVSPDAKYMLNMHRYVENTEINDYVMIICPPPPSHNPKPMFARFRSRRARGSSSSWPRQLLGMPRGCVVLCLQGGRNDAYCLILCVYIYIYVHNCTHIRVSICYVYICLCCLYAFIIYACVYVLEYAVHISTYVPF